MLVYSPCQDAGSNCRRYATRLGVVHKYRRSSSLQQRCTTRYDVCCSDTIYLVYRCRSPSVFQGLGGEPAVKVEELEAAEEAVVMETDWDPEAKDQDQDQVLVSARAVDP